MPYQLSADIQQLVEDCIAIGAYSGLDEVLRAALEALQLLDADRAKFQEAVEEWQAGDEGLPLNKAFQFSSQSSILLSSPV